MTKSLINYLVQQPLLCAASITITCVITVVFAPGLLISDEQSREMLKIILRFAVAIPAIIIMIKLGWGDSAGLTISIHNWGKWWPLTTVPMFLVCFANVSGVEWLALEVPTGNLLLWLFSNVSVGLFEEVLLRGVCFYILYRAWGHTRSGLYKAAVVQALIFGLLHLFNLSDHSITDTLAQVLYATLLGIGFVGLVVHNQSIWPAVFVHTAIDAAGSVSASFQSDYVMPSTSIGMYAIAITIIMIISTIPGLFYLQRAVLRRALGPSE